MNPLKSRVIINPLSGVGSSDKIERLLGRLLDPQKFELSTAYTTHAGHAAEIAKRAKEEGVDVVFVAGGDGTVNEVGSALTHSNTALAILPCGSGNGIARSLGIPTNIKRAIEFFNTNARMTKIDTAVFDGQVFIGIAGIGFDALVSHEFHKYENRGLSGYIKAISQKIITFKSGEIQVTTKDKSIKEKVFLAVIANSNQFGNNARISPLSEMDDGLLNLILVKDMPKILLPAEIIRLFNGSFHKSPHVVTLLAEEFNFTTDFSNAHLDGEPILCPPTVNVKVVPKSLTVLA